MGDDRKIEFKTVALFVRLGLLRRVIQRRLPKGYLERKRGIDFRVARKVVRQRWLTVRQLADCKDSLSLRRAVIRAR